MHLVLTLGGLYLVVCVLFYALQARVLYFPSDQMGPTPAHVELRFDDLTLTTEDGVKLGAWAIEGGRPWVLYCHGNGGNIAGRLEIIALLHGMNASVLVFDYRGYGRSEGAPYEQGLYRDAEAAWKYLTDTLHIPPEDIVIWGESLGGGVATWLARRHPPRALVLQSTFTSVVDMGQHVYPWLPVSLLCRNRFPSVDRVGAIACPKLFLHSPTDDLIPYDQGRRLYEAACEPKKRVDLEGGHNHGMATQPKPVLAAIQAFLSAPRP